MMNNNAGVIQFNRWVNEAKDRTLTWTQEAARLAYEEWRAVGAPVLIYRDVLTGATYLNESEKWRLGELIGATYTAEMLLAKKHPALTDILNQECHKPEDWAGKLAKLEFDKIEPENTGWSFLEAFVPDYNWYLENAELSKEQVDELWEFESLQCCQSIARSIKGETAKGMFVLMSNGGQGKSTFIEGLCGATQRFVLDAMKERGLAVSGGTSIISTDNMAGNSPDQWALSKAMLNSVCTYYTEKASYLNNPTTLDLFKGITAGASIEFRVMHSQQKQRGTQRATIFLDFNPSMTTVMLSGKLGADVDTARRFMCFYIDTKNPDAWQVDNTHPDGGYLKMFGTAEGLKRFWRHVKWADTQKEVLHGTIPDNIKPLFDRLITALSASSATSSVNQLIAQLQDETRLFVNKQYLESVGIQKRELERAGRALDDHLLTNRGKHQFTLYLDKKQHKLGRSDWVITKDGKSWDDIKQLMADLFEQMGIDTNDKPKVKAWLEQLVWRETEDWGWSLSNSTLTPLGTAARHLAVVGNQPTYPW